jgi:hypothetical protein
MRLAAKVTLAGTELLQPVAKLTFKRSAAPLLTPLPELDLDKKSLSGWDASDQWLLQKLFAPFFQLFHQGPKKVFLVPLLRATECHIWPHGDDARHCLTSGD